MRVVSAFVAILVVAASAAAAAGHHHNRRRQARFTISVAVTAPLRPGIGRPLNLRLHNPHRYALRVTLLQVATRVDRDHDHAGCPRLRNLHVSALPRAVYPLRVPARSTRSLTDLRIPVRHLPRLTMRDLAVNQDACKGARISLRLSGRATRWRRR